MPSQIRISSEKVGQYRATMRRREEEDRQAREQRRREAWQIARCAAELLKNEFGATRILLFGSLLKAEWFTQTSDIDLAAWGLKDEYFTAVAKLQDLSTDFKVDLIAVEQCSSALRAAIIESGIPL